MEFINVVNVITDYLFTSIKGLGEGDLYLSTESQDEIGHLLLIIELYLATLKKNLR